MPHERPFNVCLISEYADRISKLQSISTTQTKRSVVVLLCFHRLIVGSRIAKLDTAMDSQDMEVAGTVVVEDPEVEPSPFASEPILTGPTVTNTTGEQYPRSLDSINAEFFHHVNSYKQFGGEKVFSVALIEYLRVLKSCRDSNSSVFESLYQKVCDAENDEQLKSIVTTEMWEKVSHYVDTLDANEPTKPLLMFNQPDFPTAQANYGLVEVVDDGSLKVDQVTLGDMNVQDVTQAVGLVVQNRLAGDDEPTSSLKWQTFHVTKLPEKEKMDFSSFAKAAVSRVRASTKFSGSVRSTLKATKSLVEPEDQSIFLEGEPTEFDVKFGRGGGTK